MIGEVLGVMRVAVAPLGPLKVVIVVVVVAGAQRVTWGVSATAGDLPAAIAAKGELVTMAFIGFIRDFPALRSRGVAHKTATAKLQGVWFTRVSSIEELGFCTGKKHRFAVWRDMDNVTGMTVGVGSMGGFIADLELTWFVFVFHGTFSLTLS